MIDSKVMSDRMIKISVLAGIMALVAYAAFIPDAAASDEKGWYSMLQNKGWYSFEGNSGGSGSTQGSGGTSTNSGKAADSTTSSSFFAQQAMNTSTGQTSGTVPVTQPPQSSFGNPPRNY